ELVGDDVVGGAVQREEPGAGNDQRTGAGIVGGAGNGRNRHVTDGDAVARGIRHDHGGIGTGRPVLGRRHIVGGAAGGAGAVLVDDLIDGGLVRGAEAQRKAAAGGDIHVRRIGQRVGGAALAGEGELVGDDVVSSAVQREEPGAGNDQRTGAGIVGGAGNGRYRHVADGDAVARGIRHDHGGIGTGRPVLGSRHIVGGAAGGANAVLVDDLIDGGLVRGAEAQRKAAAGGNIHVRRIGQRVGGAALAGEGELVGDDVVGGAVQREEPGAGNDQRTGAGIVGGAGNGRYRHVADGDAVARGIRHDHGGIGTGRPVLGRRHIVGGAAGGAGAVLVDDLIDGGLVRG